MIRIKNEIFIGSDGRASLIDVTIPEDFNNKICFFIHGYKGYKDWGAWNLVEEEFVKKGYGFVKFNFSHNGGTVENGIDFPDLNAFSENNYSKELFDIAQVLSDFESNFPQQWNTSKKYLIGHSRGGGGVILAASENKNIDGLITWAAISDIKERFPVGEELATWKEKGVRYVVNGRTKQNMPHKYSFYTDFIENEDKLNIQLASRSISCPWLVVHGSNDEAVSIKDADKLNSWSDSELRIIENTGHTFDTKHPYKETVLPAKMQEVVERTIEFLEKN